MARSTGKFKFGAVSVMLLCSVIGLFTAIDSYSESQDVEWSIDEFPIPFAFDPQTDPDVESSPTEITLSVTDPALNQNPASTETVALTPVEDGDGLTIRIEGEGGHDLVAGSGMSGCSGFGSALFAETGADTGTFEKTFTVSSCGLDAEELANAELVAEYKGEHDSTVFRGYNGDLEASAKSIYTGLEVTITVTDQDQNKDAGSAEQVKIELEPDGLEPEFASLDETGENTGVFTREFLVGHDLDIMDGGLVDDVIVRYVDAAGSDGSMKEQELVLAVQTDNAELAASPSSGIAPQAEILITLSDRDLNEDPQTKDIIDYDVLRVRTSNDEIADSEIKLGEDGLKMWETAENSGVFELDIMLVPAIKMDEVEFSASTGELEIPSEPGDMIVISYRDKSHDGDGNDTLTVTIGVESYDPVIATDKDEYLPGDVMAVTVEDPDANMDSGLAESRDVHAYSGSDPVGNFFSAVETGENTGVFAFEVGLEGEFGPGAIVAELGDWVTIEYEDEFPADSGDKHMFSISVPVGDAASQSEAEDVVVQNIDSTIGNATVGQHVMLSTEIENSLDKETDFVAMVEVRNSEGITVFFAWQTGTLERGALAKVALTWEADMPGEYEVRTFVLDSLANPQVLSGVRQSGITVA